VLFDARTAGLRSGTLTLIATFMNTQRSR